MIDFNFQAERFADIQMLRYRLNGFDNLSLQQKKLVYYLSKATLFGRDITFDQAGAFNLRIRRLLEVVYTDRCVDRETDDFAALEEYFTRVKHLRTEYKERRDWHGTRRLGDCIIKACYFSGVFAPRRTKPLVEPVDMQEVIG